MYRHHASTLRIVEHTSSFGHQYSVQLWSAHALRQEITELENQIGLHNLLPALREWYVRPFSWRNSRMLSVNDVKDE